MGQVSAGPVYLNSAGPGLGGRQGGAEPTWPQQFRPGAGTQDAPGLQAVALLQHSLGQAAQSSIQGGHFPAGSRGDKREAVSGATL